MPQTSINVFIHLYFSLVILLINVKISENSKAKCYFPGSLSDGLDCRGYYTCVKGVRVHGNCKASQVFVAKFSKCVRIPTKICTSREAPDMRGKKCDKPQQKRPFFIECTSYLQCKNGTWEQILCPEKRLYSHVLGTCVFEDDVCRTTAPDEQLSFMFETNQDNPYFIECENEKVTRFSGYHPDPYDCALFFRCGLENPSEEDMIHEEDGTVESKRCPPKQLFDNGTLACQDSKNVVCGERYREVEIYGPDPAVMGRMARGPAMTRPPFRLPPGRYAFNFKRIGHDLPKKDKKKNLGHSLLGKESAEFIKKMFERGNNGRSIGKHKSFGRRVPTIRPAEKLPELDYGDDEDDTDGKSTTTTTQPSIQAIFGTNGHEGNESAGEFFKSEVVDEDSFSRPLNPRHIDDFHSGRQRNLNTRRRHGKKRKYTRPKVRPRPANRKKLKLHKATKTTERPTASISSSEYHSSDEGHSRSYESDEQRENQEPPPPNSINQNEQSKDRALLITDTIVHETHDDPHAHIKAELLNKLGVKNQRKGKIILTKSEVKYFKDADLRTAEAVKNKTPDANVKVTQTETVYDGSDENFLKDKQSVGDADDQDIAKMNELLSKLNEAQNQLKILENKQRELEELARAEKLLDKLSKAQVRLEKLLTDAERMAQLSDSLARQNPGEPTVSVFRSTKMVGKNETLAVENDREVQSKQQRNPLATVGSATAAPKTSKLIEKTKVITAPTARPTSLKVISTHARHNTTGVVAAGKVNTKNQAHPATADYARVLHGSSISASMAARGIQAPGSMNYRKTNESELLVSNDSARFVLSGPTTQKSQILPSSGTMTIRATALKSPNAPGQNDALGGINAVNFPNDESNGNDPIAPSFKMPIDTKWLPTNKSISELKDQSTSRVLSVCSKDVSDAHAATNFQPLPTNDGPALGQNESLTRGAATVPPGTVPSTAIPLTTVPPTSVPQTTAPPTTAPPTTAPPTAVPPTTAPPTTVPSATSFSPTNSTTLEAAKFADLKDTRSLRSSSDTTLRPQGGNLEKSYGRAVMLNRSDDTKSPIPNSGYTQAQESTKRPQRRRFKSSTPKADDYDGEDYKNPSHTRAKSKPKKKKHGEQTKEKSVSVESSGEEGMEPSKSTHKRKKPKSGRLKTEDSDEVEDRARGRLARIENQLKLIAKGFKLNSNVVMSSPTLTNYLFMHDQEQTNRIAELEKKLELLSQTIVTIKSQPKEIHITSEQHAVNLTASRNLAAKPTMAAGRALIVPYRAVTVTPKSMPSSVSPIFSTTKYKSSPTSPSTIPTENPQSLQCSDENGHQSQLSGQLRDKIIEPPSLSLLAIEDYDPLANTLPPTGQRIQNPYNRREYESPGDDYK